MINLYKMLEAQKIVEAHVSSAATIQQNCLAIIVEIGEMINEVPSVFKYWSKNQKDNRKYLLEELADVISFFLLVGTNMKWSNALHDPALAVQEVTMKMEPEAIRQSLLEITNYITSIALSRNVQYEGFEQYKYNANSKHERYFKEAWTLLLVVAFKGFHFTADQVENAFFEKASLNIQRQNANY